MQSFTLKCNVICIGLNSARSNSIRATRRAENKQDANNIEQKVSGWIFIAANLTQKISLLLINEVISVFWGCLLQCLKHENQTVVASLGLWLSLCRAHEGKVPTPITSSLPADKYFHTQLGAVTVTLLKTCSFHLLIGNRYSALGL